MQDDFSPHIQAMIERYCATGINNVDKVERMQSALDDVQGLVMKGIDKVCSPSVTRVKMLKMFAIFPFTSYPSVVLMCPLRPSTVALISNP